MAGRIGVRLSRGRGSLAVLRTIQRSCRVRKCLAGPNLTARRQNRFNSTTRAGRSAPSSLATRREILPQRKKGATWEQLERELSA